MAEKYTKQLAEKKKNRKPFRIDITHEIIDSNLTLNAHVFSPVSQNEVQI